MDVMPIQGKRENISCILGKIEEAVAVSATLYLLMPDQKKKEYLWGQDRSGLWDGQWIGIAAKNWEFVCALLAVRPVFKIASTLHRHWV
ncbi:hypothetical protein [Ulvibacterium marinum]|uniref:Uncharacterized protein n=1 Tax=Ulvibacterium marinum TaxID=2419782 RepID=A0A3B0CB26_9FLAO|nr:hypothetical protein [Ulvibacterium marinum]RKN80757.1 hypothetical protein D7Z94_07250 [Ulvibacterium marinum]